MKKKILIPLGIIFLGIGIYFVFFYNKAAYDRQHEQESMADEFIAYLKDNAESLDGKENGKEEAPTVNIDIPDKESAQEPSGDDTGEPAETEGEKESETLTDYTIVDGVKYLVSDSSFTDDAYLRSADGRIFTPDYAAGGLFCVLEYEKLGIRRGVYSGTWADRDTNLDRWITNLANPYMKLGVTSITIEGHNHTSQNLSFNAIKDAAIGDTFILYSTSGIYVYEVRDIYIMTRDLTRVSLINDLTGYSSDICFITSCGRDFINVTKKKYIDPAKSGFGYANMYENVSGYESPSQLMTSISPEPVTSRYHDIVLEGHLIGQYTLTEYGNGVLDAEKKWKD